MRASKRVVKVVKGWLERIKNGGTIPWAEVENHPVPEHIKNHSTRGGTAAIEALEDYIKSKEFSWTTAKVEAENENTGKGGKGSKKEGKKDPENGTGTDENDD